MFYVLNGSEYSVFGLCMMKKKQEIGTALVCLSDSHTLGFV